VRYPSKCNCRDLGADYAFLIAIDMKDIQCTRQCIR
jgi:hypothetical protein